MMLQLVEAKGNLIHFHVVTVRTPCLFVQAVFHKWGKMTVVGKIHANHFPTHLAPSLSNPSPIPPTTKSFVAVHHEHPPRNLPSSGLVPGPMDGTMWTTPNPVLFDASLTNHP